MIYFIADTHFCHEKIIRYCNRPFSNADEMDDAMIVRWNRVVKNRDAIWHLGDFALTKDVEKMRDIMSRLNGHKYLVLGNHDLHPVQVYYDVGFKYVSKYPIIFKKFYILSHEPMFVNSNMPYFNIHGHMHDNMVCQTKTEQTFCVSVERHDYSPVKLDGLG
jgi:calcineurin-like phosphoesterase family protein